MGLRWLKATLLWCATVKCDDYTLIEVKSKNGDAHSIKICAAFNGDVSSILDGWKYNIAKLGMSHQISISIVLWSTS